MRIGIFGGSFNPVHIKHIEIAKDLINKNYLDKVIFVPTGIHYEYKNNLISNKDRLNMLKIAIKDNDNLLVSDYELKEQVVHTYETLDYFKNLYKEDEIFFICGSDNLSYIDKWANSKYILSNYKIIVIRRNEYNLDDIINELKEYKSNIIISNITMDNISSTFIRKSIKDNKDISKFLDSKVKNYIYDNKLYLKEEINNG